ncbi:MAG: hypothetical protein RR415_05755 [Ruthenibacterium sp.]
MTKYNYFKVHDYQFLVDAHFGQRATDKSRLGYQSEAAMAAALKYVFSKTPVFFDIVKKCRELPVCEEYRDIKKHLAILMDAPYRDANRKIVFEKIVVFMDVSDRYLFVDSYITVKDRKSVYLGVADVPFTILRSGKMVNDFAGLSIRTKQKIEYWSES